MKKIILEEITTEELKEIIRDAFGHILIEQRMTKTEKHETESYLMTRQDVANHLQISLVTLRKMTEDGKLISYTLSKNRVRYKRDEIEGYISRCNK